MHVGEDAADGDQDDGGEHKNIEDEAEATGFDVSR